MTGTDRLRESSEHQVELDQSDLKGDLQRVGWSQVGQEPKYKSVSRTVFGCLIYFEIRPKIIWKKTVSAQTYEHGFINLL